MDESVVLICALVAVVDEPVLGSVVGRCGMCKEDVWMSPKMVEFRIAQPNSEIRCLPCAYGEHDFSDGHTVRAVPGEGPEADRIARRMHGQMSALQQLGVKQWPFDHD